MSWTTFALRSAALGRGRLAGVNAARHVGLQPITGIRSGLIRAAGESRWLATSSSPESATNLSSSTVTPSSPAAANSTAPTAKSSQVVDKEGDIIVDRAGESWIAKIDSETGKLFYYNEKSWESRNERPLTAQDSDSTSTLAERVKPEYATDWHDPQYPDWVQYIEFQSKRAYYHNFATGETTWSPPDQPELDVFKKEIEEMATKLTAVPDSVPSAPIGKRFLAGVVDAGASFAAGCAFGTLVYLDIGNLMGAGASVSLSTWALFMGRDMIFERGTRSPGKRLLKLEIVRTDGQLPSRWNNFFRQIYLPVYLGSVYLMPYIFFFSAADLGAMMFTSKRQRLGDFIAQTRVINEQPDREFRLDEKSRIDDEDDAKE